MVNFIDIRILIFYILHSLLFLPILNASSPVPSHISTINQDQITIQEISIAPLPSSPTSNERIIFSTKNRRHIMEFIGTIDQGMALIRHGKMWLLIFDRQNNYQIPRDDITNDLFENINVLPSSQDITIIEFKPKDNIVFSVKKVSGNWALQFSYQSLKEISDEREGSQAIEIQEIEWPKILVHNLKSYKEIFLEYDDADFYIVPTKEIDDGLRIEYHTPFYKMEKTIQGFACQILGNQAFFERQENHLTISIKDPLKLYYDPKFKDDRVDYIIMKKEENQDDYNLAAKTYIDIFNFFRAPYPLTIEFRRAWLNILVGDGEKTLLHLELLKQQYPGVEHHQTFKILYSLAAIIEKKYDTGLKEIILCHPSREIELWEQVCFFKTHQFVLLNPILTEAQRILLSYPKFLRKLMLESILEVADTLNNRQALIALSQTELLPNDPVFNLVHDFYLGRIEQINKNFDLAASYFKLLLADPNIKFLHPRLQTAAQLEVLSYQIDKKEINIEQGIDKLIDLRLSWRGDELEYYILRKIIDYKIQIKDYFQALKFLKRIKKLFPQLVVVDGITTQMETVFKNYFSENEGKLSPMKTIALYQEFKYLIPAGKEGEEIVSSVVDQLFNLDLLDQAAELLLKAIAKLDESTEKQKMRLRSAEIHLINNKYDDALATLSDIPDQVIPQVYQQKTLFMADAYLGKGMKKEAINILGGSTEPKLLRKAVDILISDQNWIDACKYLEILVSLLDQKTHPEDKKKAIRDLAVTYYLCENYNSLRLLAAAHEIFMKEDRLFEFLTREREKPLKNFESAMKEIKDFEDLQKVFEEWARSESNSDSENKKQPSKL